MVEDGAFSHKIDYITIFKGILNLKGDQNHITGVFAGWVVFAYWWSFISEGSASAACAAGLLKSDIEDLLIFSKMFFSAQKGVARPCKGCPFCVSHYVCLGPTGDAFVAFVAHI